VGGLGVLVGELGGRVDEAGVRGGGLGRGARIKLKGVSGGTVRWAGVVVSWLEGWVTGIRVCERGVTNQLFSTRLTLTITVLSCIYAVSFHPPFFMFLPDFSS
jgi:hypothetical protein